MSEQDNKRMRYAVAYDFIDHATEQYENDESAVALVEFEGESETVWYVLFTDESAAEHVATSDSYSGGTVLYVQHVTSLSALEATHEGDHFFTHDPEEDASWFTGFEYEQDARDALSKFEGVTLLKQSEGAPAQGSATGDRGMFFVTFYTQLRAQEACSAYAFAFTPAHVTTVQHRKGDE